MTRQVRKGHPVQGRTRSGLPPGTRSREQTVLALLRELARSNRLGHRALAARTGLPVGYLRWRWPDLQVALEAARGGADPQDEPRPIEEEHQS